MYTYNDLILVNAKMKTTNIKGKPYVEVNERIKAFRQLCPNGSIVTEMLSNEGGVCVIRASIYDAEKNLIGTGMAYENEKNGNINRTSYIENCETSAVGRALGMCGFGIDTSIASYEEVDNAIRQQEIIEYRTKKTPRQLLFAKLVKKGIDAEVWAAENGVDKNTPEDVIIALLEQMED